MITRPTAGAAGTVLLALTLHLSPGPARANEVEYRATPLSDTVSMIQARGGNVAVSAGDDGVFIIDDQYKPSIEGLLAAIGEISDRPVRFVINTHYHGDHVGGNEAIGAGGGIVVAHDNIRKRMSSAQFNHFWGDEIPAWPAGALPVVTFSDRVTLHLNGEAVTAYHVPRGHTDGDSIIHFPASNVLHMGDIFFNGLYPYIDLDGGGTIQGMIGAVERGLELADGETKVIPGHGPLTDRDGLAAYHAMLVEIRDRVQALVDQGLDLAQAVAARPTAPWDEALGKAFIKPDALVIFVYNSLTGVDRYTPLEEAAITTE
jgi:glyoxylase-like metal-dependent hydrolase (beta-lactamase superfamily II)